VALEPAHHHRGLACRLACAGEVGGRRGLVGDGDPGGAELAAVAVEIAAEVLQRREAGDPDRDIALAVAPGAAEGVGDDDGGSARQRSA
jgi:hypothetical protein